MPPKSYNTTSYSIYYDQYGNSYAYNRTAKQAYMPYTSAENYIERNMELLDNHNYESFIDNCPSRLFVKVMDILTEAEIDWTIGLTKEHIDRIDRARGYPF